MLKSTHKPPAKLPEGWTQHKAPDGKSAEHKEIFKQSTDVPIGNHYYYNNTTKQSTYVRPTQQPQHILQSLHEAFGGDAEQHHDAYITNDPINSNGAAPQFESHGNRPFSQNDHYLGRSGGRGGQPRPQPKDRPKRKSPIPGCPPWLLVQTKLGRRFVYNPENEKSFWKFPPDVMRAVVDYDRLEREKRMRNERGKSSDAEDAEQAAAKAEIATAGGGDGIPTAAAASTPVVQEPAQKMVDSDGEEYEEVEVTDDEEDNHLSKRQKTEEGDENQQPVEFNEDDIAYQLAAMGEDYGLDPGEYGDGVDEELEEGAEGLALTEEDSRGLFKDMLSDNQISPYTPWDKVIEAGHIIEDDRYTILPNMKARKDVWDEWSRDTIQRLKEQREKEEKRDPRIPYFAFLQSHATPKLYWPEFRRKHKKEPEIHSTKISDKDREKWYREYISRLKLPESTLKRDLVPLLNSTRLHVLNGSTTVDTLPTSMLTDLRYISLRSTVRDPLIEAHISSLPAAPTNASANDMQAQSDRERREQALATRQEQVAEEKRRQNGALQHSRGMLLEGEEEIRKAMMVGKQGLLGHAN